MGSHRTQPERSRRRSLKRPGAWAAVAALAGSLALAGAGRDDPPVPLRREPECAVPVALPTEALIEAGRYWHAQRALPAQRVTGVLPMESVLVRAVIAEGLERYADVDALLRRARGGDTTRSWLLLAGRAAERAERWSDAAARYRRVLELGDPTSEGRDARLASARLAFVLERFGSRDSAIAAWRRAAQFSPEIADWIALRRAALERDTAIAFAALSAPRTPGAEQQSQLFIAGRLASLGNREAALAIYQRYGRPLDVAREEFALGRRATARARADTMLFRDPAHPYRPDAILAATFLSERFNPLSLQENVAASIAYRTRRDFRGAEQFAAAAVREGKRLRPDTSISGWLELARVQSGRRNLLAALRSIDSANARSRGRAPLIGVARLQAIAEGEYRDRAAMLLDQLVRAHPGDTTIARAVLNAADQHRLREEIVAERERYRTLLTRFPDAPATNAARFRSALTAYLHGLRDSALAVVTEVARRDSTHSLGLGPRYWEARIRLELGDSSAVTSLRAISAQQPIAFYGVRARELVGDTAFLADSMPPLPRPGSFAPARARERVKMLASLGFDTEARAEAVGWAVDTSASVYVLMAAAAAAGEAGYARESILLGDSARRRAGMVPGVARALFPISYRSALEAEAAEHCVDPLLMAALIRQESRFDPRAVSRVGARGLGQIMPATGQQMAQERRLGTWDANLLFVPDFNLHMSAQYITDRMRREPLPVYALLASYNAGPTRLNRWKRWPEYDDPDLFAERVSIAETRDYVRTIYASYVWYRYAWAVPAAPVERQAPVP